MMKSMYLLISLSFFGSCTATDGAELAEDPVKEKMAAPALAPKLEESTACGASVSASQDDAAIDAVDRARTDDLGRAVVDGWETQAECTADCGSLPDVSCSGSSCSAEDRNCGSGQQGYVECNGVRTYCAVCSCTEGQLRYRSTNVCCCNYDNPENPKARRMSIEEICINGAWVQNATYCSGANCGGICPV